MLRVLGLTGLILPLFATAAAAQSVVRPEDGRMTCAQMADEAATLSAGFGEDSPGVFGRLGGVARAGAAMLVPGAGLAIAGADAMTQPGRDAGVRRDQEQRDRWNYLNGLYIGRGCDADIEPAAAPAVPASPPAVTPTVAPVNATLLPAEQARNESGPNH